MNTPSDASMSEVDPVAKACHVARRLMGESAIGEPASVAARALEQTVSR